MILINNIKNVKKDKSKEDNDIDISNTAIEEILDIVKDEYTIERGKKQSLEIRSGLVMTIFGSISLFILEKVRIIEILNLFNIPMSFLTLIKILSGILVYICFIITIFTMMDTLNVKKHDNFDVTKINDKFIEGNKFNNLKKIINTYKLIVNNHREMNDIRAKKFRKSLQFIFLTFYFVITYLNIE